MIRMTFQSGLKEKEKQFLQEREKWKKKLLEYEAESSKRG